MATRTVAEVLDEVAQRQERLNEMYELGVLSQSDYRERTTRLTLAREAAERLRAQVEGDEEEDEVQLDSARPTPLLFDVAETCRLLGSISKQMLYRVVNRGEVRPVKLGTRSMFTMAELQRYVEELVRSSYGADFSGPDGGGAS
jgi:hypothetical protein